MVDYWMPTAIRHDLSRDHGYGPFKPGMFLGVVVHVNVGHTSPDWYASNPESVCPNFQVDKDGTIYQMLPLNWQPWAQRAGNTTYAAIETEGYPTERYTPAQAKSIARILDEYALRMKMEKAIANAPGQRGIATHRMGGEAWGGHSCPGDIRANQRGELLKLMTGPVPAPVKPRPAPRVPAYPLPAGHYFGYIGGPNESHGGYYKGERAYVSQIRAQLARRGFKTNDAPGIFGVSTVAAVSKWQHKYYEHQTSLFGEVWADDWARLMGGKK